MDYYTNSGQKWLKEEENKLLQEYNEEKLDINEIGKIHKRRPSGISARLCKLGIINERSSARGYEEYINSSLFKINKDIRRENRKSRSSKKDNSFICIKECDYLELKEELTDVKIELKEIKNMIKKLAIYEFDD